MASIRFFWVAACLLPAVATAAERLVWFGTYTNPQSGSEGIYVARFDTDRGTFTKPVLAAAARNPSFLAFHPRLPMLYAVSEITGAAGKPEGCVAAFAVDEQTGTLTPRGERASGGGGPCHVTVDPTGKAVLAANYGGGSLICLGLTADGEIEPVTAGTPGGFIQHGYERAGTPGINERRQEKAHAHSVDVAPDGRFAFCCDLGLDQVLVYRLDAGRATLEPHGKAAVAAGAGPRHFALHPGGRFAWCVNELNLTVTGFASDAAAGTLAEIQTLSTLPDDVRDRTGFSCAEIAVHPSGRFLYASNRGHDSIAMYAIDEGTGRLTFLGAEPTRAKTPRHFAIAPGGRFLLAAGQGSGTVTVFTIDEATGTLAFTGESVEVPAPVCILFRPGP
ncbi:MAG: lactonase family protein [Planctomycetota bacterium]